MKQNVDRLLRHYDTAITWGEQDHGEALHGAIEAGFSMLSDERKAEIFCRLQEQWDQHPAGVLRRIYVTDTITRYNIDYAFGAEIEAANKTTAEDMAEDGDDVSGLLAILAKQKEEQANG